LPATVQYGSCYFSLQNTFNSGNVVEDTQTFNYDGKTAFVTMADYRDIGDSCQFQDIFAQEINVYPYQLSHNNSLNHQATYLVRDVNGACFSNEQVAYADGGSPTIETVYAYQSGVSQPYDKIIYGGPEYEGAATPYGCWKNTNTWTAINSGSWITDLQGRTHGLPTVDQYVIFL
jgi:hypothetical protein